MEFTIPTNIDEMYETLNELFHYYRIKRETYEFLDLKPLNIPRLTINQLNNEQLTEKAQELLNGEQQREVLKLKKEIQEKISALNIKIILLEQNYLVEVENITKRYTESENKINAELASRGLTNSTIAINKIAQLETEKNNKLSTLENSKNEKIAEYQSQITALNTELANVNSYYLEVFNSELVAKTNELINEQEKQLLEIQKYNNSLEEQEIKYENNIIKINADLKVKYAQLKGQFMSKEELVEMGYYADVLDCVCGYYNTLTPINAYNSFKAESKLAIYLDDYYTNILYLYKTNAGL